jgi:hypothetical protein
MITFLITAMTQNMRTKKVKHRGTVKTNSEKIEKVGIQMVVTRKPDNMLLISDQKIYPEKQFADTMQSKFFLQRIGR